MIRYHARWVLPVTNPPIENGTVVEHEGRIVFVGPRSAAPAGEDYDLGDAFLMPGLVNAHTHLELTAMRGLLEGLEFHEWIARLRAMREEVLDEAMLLDSARWGIVEGIRAGVTTYADTCSSGVALTAMRELGVRGIMYQEVFGPDPSRCEAMIEDLRQRIARLRDSETQLVRLGVSPHAPYTVSDVLYVEAARLAGREELPIAVHVAESDAERQLVVEGCGPFADALRKRGIDTPPRARSPIALLEKSGLLNPRTLLIHCVRVDSSDVALIHEAGCGIAHCPVSNAKLGHGVAPLLELLSGTDRVGLGSDSMASNDRMDMLEEARMAVLQQRARALRADVLPVSVALRLATLGGARALGLDSRVGSLEAGKDADLVAFPLDGLAPIGDPEAAAIFALGGRAAIFVTVAGRRLVEKGRLSIDTTDTTSLRDRVIAAGDALARWHLSPVTLS